jgi:hypothetical protein
MQEDLLLAKKLADTLGARFIPPSTAQLDMEDHYRAKN